MFWSSRSSSGPSTAPAGHLRGWAPAVPAVGDFLSRAWPPNIDRLDRIGLSILETFQMALVGTVVGVILSLPFAILAARGLLGSNDTDRGARAASSPCSGPYRTSSGRWCSSSASASVRSRAPWRSWSTPSDFCGRFFAEQMEDVDRGPQEALTCDRRVADLDTIMCTVIPAAMPAFITTSLFALEKSTRSSVVLGLVGAGGIGLELKVAMDLFDYQTAMTIILLIFALVIAVERAGFALRNKVLQETN